MRIYKSDGSFNDYPNDIEFGWYFSEIVGDVADFNDAAAKTENLPTITSIEDSFMESVDIVEPVKLPMIVERVDPKVILETIANVVDCKLNIEGPVVDADERTLQNINFTIPPKERLVNLINPYNYETKMLMAIVCFAKYKCLMKKENAVKLFNNVNYRTTNFKCLIKESDISQEMYKEIQSYHAMKEENMLSLMMELILTDMNCNLDDIVDVNEPQPVTKRTTPQFVFDTSDLGNSIQSSCSSKVENPNKSNHLTVSSRSSILSSIGLEEQYRSIQSFSEETTEMHCQLGEIKRSFEEEEDRVNNLIKVATDLEKDLKETLYLNDILHLLKGDIEKVKLKKLPFRIFHNEKGKGSELNLIV